MREWIKQWNRWRKYNKGSWIYKILVLLKIERSWSLEVQIEGDILGKVLTVAAVELSDSIDKITKDVACWAEKVTKALEETNNIK